MKETILVTNPHLQSQAALVILRRKYVVQDNSTRGYWLRFRQTLLSKWLAQGPLMCAYCAAGPLHIDHPELEQVATLDHVIPRSRGGATYDEANLVVACTLCNEKKGDKIEGWSPRS